MKKITMVLLALLIFGLAAVGFANAHQSSGNDDFKTQNLNDGFGMMGNSDRMGNFDLMADFNWQEHHEAMEKIMEDGTYEDFLAYQKETKFKMPMKIKNQEDFLTMQKHHESMEEFRNENGLDHGMQGMMNKMHGQKNGFGPEHGDEFEGCLMHD